METHRTTSRSGNRYLLASGALFVIAGAFLLVSTWINSTPYDSDEKQGIVMAGLTKNPESVCGTELYEVSDGYGDTYGCSHGPDAAAEGVDVTKVVSPLDSATAAANTSILCDGDGVSGYRTEMIYAVAADKVNNYTQYEASFQTYAANMNNIFVQSGLETGSARNVRFVTNVGCDVVVRNVTLTATGDDSIGNTRAELLAQGYNRSDRKYMVWADATVYCGIAYVFSDSRPGQDNVSNSNLGFGRIDRGCWGGSVEAHELMHTLGGVQRDSPNSNNAYHCTDEYDRMCYDDGSGAVLRYLCVGAQEQRFDCNKDDYFNSGTPVAGTYLDTHWNTANSQFLIKDQVTAPIVTPPAVAPPPPAASAPPPATVTLPTPPPPTPPATSTAPPAPKTVAPAPVVPPPEPVVTPPPAPVVVPKPEPVVTKPTQSAAVNTTPKTPTTLQLKLAGKHIDVPYSWLWSTGAIIGFVALSGAGWGALRGHRMLINKLMARFIAHK